MASVNRVYIARLSRMLVLGPLGESFGRIRDVVISISIVRQQPRVLGLVVDLATRRSIFIPMLRVAAIEPGAVTLNTGSVSLRHFEQRPGEVLAIGQVLDTQVKVNDPALPELAGLDVVVTDLGIEQTRTRDWMVSRVAVRSQRRLGRRGPVHVVDWHNVQGLTPSALALPGQGVAQLLDQFEGWKAVDVADVIRGLPPKRRYEVLKALDDDRLADVLQELPELDQADVLSELGAERSADVLEEMDPDDAADLLGVLNPTDAEMLLTRMDPGEFGPGASAAGTFTRHRGWPDDLGSGGADARHVGRRGAGPGPRPRPHPRPLIDGVRGAPAHGHTHGSVPGLCAAAAAASRSTGGTGRWDRRHRPAHPDAGNTAGGGDPLPGRVQPGVRTGAR